MKLGQIAFFSFISASLVYAVSEDSVMVRDIQLEDTVVTEFSSIPGDEEIIIPLLEDTVATEISTADSEEIILQSINRLPLILQDAKRYFVEALIADQHNDTMEVVYLIEKITDLLIEAGQVNGMLEDDQEEYTRFENMLIHAYENHFRTVNRVETPITVASLREELSEYMEPLEIEINGSKFTVIDDRNGHIPLVLNSRVEQTINFFRTKGKRQFEIWLSRLPFYKESIIEILTENGLPEELIYVSMVESGFNPKAYSTAHASGLWQFVSGTAKMYGLSRTWWIDERRDPRKATQAAADYFKDLYIEFDDWYLAMAAYNSGEGRINRAIRLHQTRDFWQLNSLPRETRNYVPTVLAAAIITRDPAKYGFKVSQNNSLEYDEVIIESSADLNVLAKCAGISMKQLRKYNPEIRQFATPSNQPYSLKIPKGSKDTFTKEFNSLPKFQRFVPQYLVHRVRRGESLWVIARKYGVSIYDVASVNKIRNYHRLQIGQKLTIPVPPVPGTSSIASSKVSEKDRIVYRVRKGDTLGHIAERYGTSARRIRQLNGLRYGQYIYPGQKLVIPASPSKLATTSSGSNPYEKEIYVVRRGDTLSHIAMRYRTSVSKVRRWNGISRNEYIYPGQKLVIYVK